MEHYKISKLLNNSTVSKLVKRKFEVKGLSGGQYFSKKSLRFKTPMLRSDFCDYSDVYIVVKVRVSITGDNSVNRRNKKLTFKSNALIRSCISKNQ